MANFLQNLFKSSSKKNNQSVIGIDIGSSSIKIVQLKRHKGVAVLETYGEIALGPYAGTQTGRSAKLSSEQIAQAITDLIKEANISTIDSAISIPMRSSMVSILRLPKLSDKQLSQMVPIEARKYIPVPISEVSLDWFTIPKLEDEEEITQEIEGQKVALSDVLVVAIHNDVLNDFSTIVSSAKLNTTFFEIEMFSTIRSVLEIEDAPQSVLVFDMGASATKTYIVERGIIKESHTINKGSQDITLNIANALNVSVEIAEKLKRNHGHNTPDQDVKIQEIIDLTLSSVFGQVNSIIVNYGKRFNRVVSKMVLVGGGSLLHTLSEKAQEKIGLPIIMSDPFGRTQAPAFLQEALKQSGAAFAVAVGLALRKLQELEN
jgi:type IV pilus assembly protein PilM